jgi:hypothetical protein
MQTKYIGLIIAISMIVILSLGYITFNMVGGFGFGFSSGFISDSGSVTKVDMQGNVYSGDGVSFNIPTSWQVVKFVDGTTTNINIVKNNSNTTQITIAIAPNPKDLSNQNLIDSIKNPVNEDDGNWEKISNSTISINGNTAYENTYNVTNSSQFEEPIIMKEINFIKNGYTYGLSFQAPTNEFNNEQTNFNITLNSFQVK